MQLMQTVMLKKLKKYKKQLSYQQWRTIKGQILSGDIEGASKGLNKLLSQAEKGGELSVEEERTRKNGVSVGTSTG